MPRYFLFLPILCALICAGCNSPKPATVKGSFSYEGKPFALPPKAGEVFLTFTGLDAEGKPDIFKMYKAVVQSDGSFEVASSGGELPVGTYIWSIDSAPGRVKQFEPFTMEKSTAKVEFQPGPNLIVLDLSAK